MAKKSPSAPAAGDLKRLDGKIALITGAGAGIGEASAHRFAREGATVIATDMKLDTVEKVADAIRKQGGQAHACKLDVTREDDGRKAVRWAIEEFGRIDVLFNVAGWVPGGSILQTPTFQLRKALDINVMGMFFMTKLVIPHMIGQGGGSILCVGSVAGPFAVKDRAAYSIGKAAVIGLVKSVAMDYIDKGIRCNVICPGTVETPSWHDRVNQAANPDEALKMFIARQPMGRVGQPEEIAALAAFLASGESAYMTGQALYMDGGMTM